VAGALIRPAIAAIGATPAFSSSIVGNRLQVASGVTSRFLLGIPRMGYVFVNCINGGSDPARIYWRNNEAYAIDAWVDGPWSERFFVVQPGQSILVSEKGAPWAEQLGLGLSLGFGTSPGTRRVSHVDVAVRRAALDGPCVAQAVATSSAFD
jgi:hypothetical protein